MEIAQIFADNPGTRIELGPRSLDKITRFLNPSWTKAMIVIGQGSMRRLGNLDRLIKYLDDAGLRHELFKGVESDPTDRTVNTIAHRLQSFTPDVIIALGGGSAMDAAKLANVLYIAGRELNDYMGIGGHISETLRQKNKRLLPVVTIPTTSGSGSEVTRYAVFTDTVLDLKKIIVDDALKPALALIDPMLIRTCPREVTVTVGLDTLSHLLEGYLSKVGTDHVDPWALMGLKLVFENLARAADDGEDISAREAMTQACALGGLIINEKGTGFPHGFSFSFHHQMSHGNAVALTLPACWAYSLPGVEEKTRRIAEVMGLRGEGDIRQVGKSAINKLTDFYKGLGHPTRLSQIPGVDEKLLRKAAAQVAKNEVKLRNAPRPVENGEQTLFEILQAAYRGDIDSLIGT